MSRRSFFVLLIILFPGIISAQDKNIPIGAWRVHLPYNSSSTVAIAANKIYSASNQAAFYIDEDNSISPLSKINGLSDNGISKMKYYESYDLLLITYENGNIDIIRNNEVININDIKRKEMLGSKKTNHIEFSGKHAYLSTDYGVSVLNLEKFEIKETYATLASGGQNNKVFASALTADKDSIFLATEKGVMVARVSSSVNLMDLKSWYTFKSSDSIPGTNAVSVAFSGNRIYAAINNDGIYVYNGTYWKRKIPYTGSIQGMNESGGKIFIGTVSNTTLEAEKANYSEASLQKSYKNWHGTGYLKFDTLPGFIEWSVNVPLSGNYAVAIKYTKPEATIDTFQIEVNGQVIKSKMPVYFTGDTNTWWTFPVEAPLVAGENTLNLKSDKPGNLAVDALYLPHKNNIIVIEENGNSFSLDAESYGFAGAERMPDGTVWIADIYRGLLHNKSGYFQAVAPNGPFSIEAFALYYNDNKIYAASGGFVASYVPSYRYKGIYVFENGTWTNYNISSNNFPSVRDIISFKYNSADDSLYIASHGEGLIAWKNGNYHVYNELNSPLGSMVTTYREVRVTGVDTDSEGNLWMTNYMPSGSPGLHKKPLNKAGWESFLLPGHEYPVGLLIDDEDNKWVLLNGDGLLVYKNQNNVRYFSKAAGANASFKANCLAKDKKGEILIGTNAGIAVCYDPSSVLTNSNSDITLPIFDGFPLLMDEVITSIKVDGGNRKWIGTKNGLWLFNEDLSEVLLNFTTKNSPLLSDNIVDIEIHEQTGEVFISTDQGIISYRGTATEGGEKHSDVKVFPNPVKPEYQGLVGISGLVANAIVKITDIYGNLVYETQSQGGTAVWNVKDYNGRRAKTGVYLIFSSDTEGEDTFVSKIAVIE